MGVKDDMEVSIVMGVPKNSWMVDFMQNPSYKWMISGDPHFRKPPYRLGIEFQANM